MTDCGEVMLQVALAGMGEQGVTARRAFEIAASKASWLQRYAEPIAFAEEYVLDKMRAQSEINKRRAAFRVIEGGKK